MLRLICILALILLPAVARAELKLVAVAPPAERVALVIGNENYERASSLRTPTNDATAIGRALEDLGFDVTILLDATREEMLGGLRAFSRISATADVSLIYYAGHGIEVARENFLIPTDANLTSDYDTAFEAVHLDTVLAAAEGAGGLRIVILDACRDNPFELSQRATTRQINAPLGATRGLAIVQPKRDTLIAYAAEAGEVAFDGEGENSPYTTALLDALREPGLEIEMLFSRVRAEVLETTNGLQIPAVYGSLSSDTYILNNRDVMPTPGPTPPVLVSVTQVEIVFWESIAESNFTSDFEAYLSRFPEGAFVALAQAKLERLTVFDAEVVAVAEAHTGFRARARIFLDRYGAMIDKALFAE